MDFACVVIGGGVVGAAVAAELARPGRPLLLLEREAKAGSGVTSRNSGVIHAGVHYPPSWLRTRLCVEGRRRLYEVCAARAVPHLRCGKLIVAQDTAEAGVLEAIFERGRASGVEDLEMVGSEELFRLEPEVRGVAALLSPHSGVVDPHGLLDCLLRQAEEGEGTVLLSSELVAGERLPGGGYQLTVADERGGRTTCTAETVVNAAGLDACRVAGFFLPADEVPRPHFAKGDYWAVAPRHRGKVRRLIYPVPPQGTPGLGIHLTLDLGGGMRLGPDVQWLERGDFHYQVDLGRQHVFHAAASRYLPFLQPEDLAPDMAGVRPKLSGPGEPPADFHIRHEAERGFAGLVNLLGIESPGLTAALAIGHHVARLLA